MEVTDHQCRQRMGGRERRGTGDRGVTVVEMLFATMILGVGVLGVASLFVTSTRVGSAAEVRSIATDLATGELELIRSWPYDTVGISPSAPGYSDTFDGRTTVVEDIDNQVLPSSTVERGGVVFEIERAVTWAALPGQTQAYKVVTITVTWSANGSTHAVTVQTGLFGEVVGE